MAARTPPPRRPVRKARKATPKTDAIAAARVARYAAAHPDDDTRPGTEYQPCYCGAVLGPDFVWCDARGCYVHPECHDCANAECAVNSCPWSPW